MRADLRPNPQSALAETPARETFWKGAAPPNGVPRPPPASARTSNRNIKGDARRNAAESAPATCPSARVCDNLNPDWDFHTRAGAKQEVSV